MPLPRSLLSAVIALESEDMSTTSPATRAQSQPDALDWERIPNPAASSRTPYRRRTFRVLLSSVTPIRFATRFGVAISASPRPTLNQPSPFASCWGDTRCSATIGTPFLPGPVQALDANFHERFALTVFDRPRLSTCRKS